MFSLKTIGAFIAALLLITGCRKTESSGQPVIAVSTGAQAWLAKQLMPDSVAEVATLLPPGADPESYEPAIGIMKQLANARVWLTLHTPGFEESLEPKLRSNFPNLRIADVSAGVSRDVTHFCDHHPEQEESRHHHSDNAADPHLLSSLRNAQTISANMAKELKALFPQYADSIDLRSGRLATLLQQLDDSIGNVLAQPGRGHSFFIEHPSLGYFARDYGLTQIPFQESNKEVSPYQAAGTYAKGVKNGTSVMFVEKEHPAPQHAEMMRKEGIRIVDISLYSDQYLESFRKIASSL